MGRVGACGEGEKPDQECKLGTKESLSGTSCIRPSREKAGELKSRGEAVSLGEYQTVGKGKRSRAC